MLSKKIIVIGASSLIGQYLLPYLTAASFSIQALGRRSIHQIKPAENLIYLAPLWTLPERIPQIAELNINRIIAFGSTSRFTKENSADAKEQMIVQNLAQAEEKIADLFQKYSIHWTILRPTLIYGDIPEKAGKALEMIIRIIRFGKCFPIIGNATGLRQPVHADDLAKACLAALENPSTYNQAYNLSGGETLSYHQMVERIFQTLGQKPRFIHVPLSILRAGLKIMQRIPRFHFLTLEMANRMNQNLCFDHSDATKAF